MDLAWQTLPEQGALALVDTVSRRAAAIARPHPGDLSMADIVDVERLTLAWTDPLTRSDAERSLEVRLARAPLPTLRALCWLSAMWVVTVHLRTGQQPHDLVVEMDVRTRWRNPALPETLRMWDALTERVRVGVLAALTADASMAEMFRGCVARPQGMAGALLVHALAVLDGQRWDMVAHGLDPHDMAATVALYTTDPPFAPVPCSCFRPLI